MSCVVWNVSLFNGFSYSHNKYSLFDAAFKNGLVVFLNTPFEVDDDKPHYAEKASFLPLQYLNPCDIFEAARYHGIRTYVINSTLSDTHAFTPILPYFAMPLMTTPTQTNPAINTHTAMKPIFHANFNYTRDEHIPPVYAVVDTTVGICCDTVSQRHFNKTLDDVKISAMKTLPGQQYFFRASYEPKFVKGC